MNTMPGHLITPVLAIFVIVTAAFAGGWSIITVNNLPDYAVAGKPLILTFSVRQHGATLVDGLTPTLIATTPQGHKAKATAVPTKNSGEYTAALTFDKPGEWTIRIDGGFNPSDVTRAYNSVSLSPLRVAAKDSAPPIMISKGTRGEHLFAAKGCAGCHGPDNDQQDLPSRRLSEDYVRKFLAAPSTQSGMPNLNLKDEEIAALAVFITMK